MTIYVDILMLVNFIVDYFLILLAAKFLHITVKVLRTILSAAIGGVFSLYILLPQSGIAIQMLINILMCVALCLVAFGFKNIKFFLRSVATLFCVNFAYSGAMIALWLGFKPYGMVINNSVVYFNISPIFLIVFSLVGYFGTILIRKIIKKPFLENTYCVATLYCAEKAITLDGIVDTGNSLCDSFGISQIFIVDQGVANAILENEKQTTTRFRKIPCGTVTGSSLLDGYRIDYAKIKFNNRNYEFKNPVLAISQLPLADAKIIVNPENLY